MAAPNKQPAGNRPGPGKVNTHAPHDGGMPAGAKDVGAKVTPGNVKSIRTAPSGGGKKNPLR